MRRLQIFQTTAFRWTLSAAGIVALTITLMGAFFYWQTVGYFTQRIESGLVLEAQSLASESRRILIIRLDKSLAVDPRRSKAYGLFAADGTRIAGDVSSLPQPLPPPDRAAEVTVDWIRQSGRVEPLEVRAVSVLLADGSTLFLGRATSDLREIEEIVTRAMAMAIVPAAVLALVGGALVSLATLRRVEAVRRACSLIMEGQFHRRLPVRRNRDEFDRLSEMVNRMLDEIERLVIEVKGAGDAIAHDLRTPLTRLRARLDRALDAEARHAPVPEVLQKSVADVDQLLNTVTAILRIAEVEQSRRQSGFGPVDLDDVVDAISELYLPIAEEKTIAFVALRRGPGLRGSTALRAPVGSYGGAVPDREAAAIRGDGDLVFEAVANLVDNALKFTPAGGRVGIELMREDRGPAIRVWDSGPGIPPAETEAVMRRFYRLDRSRHLPGTGLGLSLVAAIVRLHGFGLTVGGHEGGGCEVTIRCWSVAVDNDEGRAAPAMLDVSASTA